MEQNTGNRILLSRNEKHGFILLHVLVVGSLLLFLGLVFFFFANRQHANIHIQANTEMAHFLAESGLNVTTAALRGNEFSILKSLFSQSSLPSTIPLNPLFPKSWSLQLNQLAKEADPTASLQVKAWIHDLIQTETDPTLWQDPTAFNGWLSVESRGEYRGFQRTLTVRKKVTCGSALPPVTSKFTLHLQDAHQGKDGSQNTVRNDLQGTLLKGPRPIVCFNHNTPDNPIEPRAASASAGDASPPDAFAERGWIWLGGKRVRLNLAAGTGNFGELFHFSHDQTGNTPVAISFKLSADLLPRAFSSPLSLYWDRVDIDPMREVQYRLGQEFVLQGFYDKSDVPGLEAMFDNGVLSHDERTRYGVKSSAYRLFGDARPGYRSRTRVLGNVFAAFPLFSNLEVSPLESDVQASFQSQTPPPVFLLPSMSSRNFDPSKQVTEFRNRHFGGPVLAIKELTESHAEYRTIMSRIIEIPFCTTAGFLEKAAHPIVSDELSDQSPENPLILERDRQPLYRGPPDARSLVSVVERRAQKEVGSVPDFWNTFFDRRKQRLMLRHIVRIQNPLRQEMVIPPLECPAPLVVDQGGMIILEEGNLLLRGVKLSSPNDALTIILRRGTSVRFGNSLPNQVNVVALDGELSSAEQFELCGTLAVSRLSATSEFPGGTIHYRESQDPTRASHVKFLKVNIGEPGSVWHE